MIVTGGLSHFYDFDLKYKKSTFYENHHYLLFVPEIPIVNDEDAVVTDLRQLEDVWDEVT